MVLASAALFFAAVPVRANGIRTPKNPVLEKLDFGFKGGIISFTSAAGTGFLSNNPALTTHTLTHGKASTLILVAALPGGKSFAGSNLGSVVFTTGFAEPGATNSLVTYAPGGSIIITSSKKIGTGPHAVPAGTLLFSGFFSGPEAFTITKGICKLCYSAVLSGDTKSTFVSPTLLALLGLPQLNNGVFTSIDLDLSLRFQGAGVTNGSLVITPEPGTLALAGTGLLSLAGMIRRKRAIAT
jgi:hypothetical protein